MLDESIAHYREIINSAEQLMSNYFNKSIRFTRVMQISEADRRNTILRFWIDNPETKMPHSLILKKTAIDKRVFDIATSGETEVEQLSRFARDWAGVEFLTAIGRHHAPKFYAGSLEHKFIIIEDLGFSHPSLIGPLTRLPSVTNLKEAEAALMAYMRQLGKMHADTFGKSEQFTSILKRIYPQALRVHFISHSDSLEVLNQIRLLTGYESIVLQQEIEGILEFINTSNDDFSVLLHGDICPDNVFYQKNNIKMIDFEFSDYGNALIDGVYLRMCMPSCWCSKAVPDKILQHMESIYITELKSTLVLAEDEAIYNKQLVYACAYWVIRALQSLHEMKLLDNEWICPSGNVDADSKWEPEDNAFRPRILSRLEAFVSCAKKTEYLPQLGDVAARLLSHLKSIWPQTKYIDLFPVFRGLK